MSAFMQHLASLVTDCANPVQDRDLVQVPTPLKEEVEQLLKQFYTTAPEAQGLTVPRVWPCYIEEGAYEGEEEDGLAYWILWDGPFEAETIYPGRNAKGLAFIEAARAFIHRECTTAVEILEADELELYPADEELLALFAREREGL